MDWGGNVNPKLVELAKGYLEATEKIRRIEGETATSSLTARTTNDIRHLLIHITTLDRFGIWTTIILIGLTIFNIALFIW